MNKEWLEKINMTLEERANLERWCENIGYKRYESICNSIIEKTKRKSVNYSVLQVIAKYDFCLSDFLHSMLKFIELRFRSYLFRFSRLNIVPRSGVEPLRLSPAPCRG